MRSATHRRVFPCLLLSLACLLALSVPAWAQVDLSGDVYDGNGGPLLSGVVYRAVNELAVPVGQTLTVQAGVVLKFNPGRRLWVHGTLDVNATELDPTYFTSHRDDSVGGDTNGDGPSDGYRNDWLGLIFESTSAASDLEQVVIRYTGWSGNNAVQIRGAAIRMHGCLVEQAGLSGLSLNGMFAGCTIENSTIRNCSRYAATGLTLDDVPGFSNNSASGNGWGNGLHVSHPTMTTDLTFGASACMGGAVMLGSATTIPAGLTLTLDKGVVLKTIGPALTVFGTLITRGREDQPVVLTSSTDDEFGGDTNGDGASSGGWNQWGGLQFEGSSGASDLEQTVIRFTGWSGQGAVKLKGADIRMSACLVEESGMNGLDMNGESAQPTIEWTTFRNCSRFAATNVPMDAVPGFANNRATGCGWGSYLNVNFSSPTRNLTISPRNGINGFVYVSNAATVPAGVTLTLEAGTLLKLYGSGGFLVEGTLNLLGTARQPVVLTSYRDDQYGGDTNEDGLSSGYRHDWGGITYPAAAEGGRVEHAILRYAGWSGQRALRCDSPNVSARSLMVELNGEYGIEASALSGDAENWVVRGCSRDGIRLTGGSFDIVHATTASNSWAGIIKTGTYTGQARNCLSWNNTTNFSGFAAGELHHCNGSAAHDGTNGCTNLDPLFVDGAGGNLRLQSGSPCEDAGDYSAALGVLRDMDDNSRMLDPNLSGAMLPDVGAYERALWKMTVFGKPQAGFPLRFQVDGPAGSSLYMLGLLDGSQVDVPYGLITAGDASLTLLSVVPVGQSLRVEISRGPYLVGRRVGVQTRTTPAGDSSVGNITNLFWDTIRAPERFPLASK